jgi:hypothetical protein
MIRFSAFKNPVAQPGWFVERVHSARLKLHASCGTMSFLIAAAPQASGF